MSDFFKKLSDVCHEILFENESLMYYLKSRRGLTEDTIKSYKLGAFPEKISDLYLKHNMDPVELRDKGILWNADQSQFQFFPLVIPIRNISGKEIAIGARSLLSDKKRKKLGIPKYRNSIYKKTSHLFGLDRAARAIRDTNKVFVVEGYFDQIMADQKGIKNVVATSGTIFAERQMTMLSRYTDNICLLFDNDGPGRMSAKKVMSVRSEADGVNLSCDFTPRGYKDLDEYLRKGGNTALFHEERIDLDEVEIDTLW